MGGEDPAATRAAGIGQRQLPVAAAGGEIEAFDNNVADHDHAVARHAGDPEAAAARLGPGRLAVPQPEADQPVAIEWVQKDAARGDHRIRLAQWATGSPAPCVVGAGPGIGMGPEE